MICAGAIFFMRFRAFLLILIVFGVTPVFTQDTDVITAQPSPANSTIRGRVFFQDTGRPVRRGSVMLMGAGGGRREITGITDNEGFFQIKNVPAGKYYAVVNAPGVVSLMAYADLTRPRDEGIEEAALHFEPINVDGISSIDINVPAVRGGAVSGRVMYADGDAAVGVRVEVLRKTDDKFSTVVPNLSAIFSALAGGGSYLTDDRGYFRAAGLPAGQYVIRVTEKSIHAESDESYRSMEREMFAASSLLNVYYPDVFDIAKAQVVDLNFGQENPELTIMIPDRTLHKISGQVVAVKGKVPIKNARVTLKRKGDTVSSLFDNLYRSPISVNTDEKGNWNFSQLPKGTYELQAETSSASILDEKTGVYDSSPNYYGSNTNSAYRTSVAKKPEINFSRKILEITIDDKDLEDIALELAPGGSIMGEVAYERPAENVYGSVNLKLVDENEEEVAGVERWFYEAREASKGTLVEQEFTIPKVPVGKFFLRVTVSIDKYYVKSAMLKGTDLLTNPVDLTEGQILRDLQVTLGSDVGIVKGMVTDDDRQPVRGAVIILIPADPAKQKNTSLQKRVIANSEGEFEIKAAPGEYVVILKELLRNKKGPELAKVLDEAVKNGVKVKVEPGGTHKVTIKKAKAEG